MTGAALLCLVVAITDGDTLKARCGEPETYEQVTIRISAIDAPERKQPFGEVSRQHLAALCFRETARITPHGHDRYRRTVADVECHSQDVATEQVRSGLAWTYVKYAKGYERLYDVQAQAEDARRGVWSQPDPVAPWEWRHDKRRATIVRP